MTDVAGKILQVALAQHRVGLSRTRKSPRRIASRFSLLTDDGDARWTDVLAKDRGLSGMCRYAVERQDLWSDAEHAEYWEHHQPLWPTQRPGRTRNGAALADALLVHKLIHDTTTEEAVGALRYKMLDLKTRRVPRAWTDPHLTVLEVLSQMEHELDHFPGFVRVPRVVALDANGARCDGEAPEIPWLPLAFRNTLGVFSVTVPERDLSGAVLPGPGFTMPFVAWELRAAVTDHARSPASRDLRRRADLAGLGSLNPAAASIGASLREQVRSGLRSCAWLAGKLESDP